MRLRTARSRSRGSETFSTSAGAMPSFFSSASIRTGSRAASATAACFGERRNELDDPSDARIARLRAPRACGLIVTHLAHLHLSGADVSRGQTLVAHRTGRRAIGSVEPSYPHAVQSFKLSACVLRSHSSSSLRRSPCRRPPRMSPRSSSCCIRSRCLRGYQLDEDNSFAIPNAYLAAKPEGRRMVARSGRSSGYYARYTNYGSAASPRWRYVNSAADVFRRPDGAAVYLAWYDPQLRKELTGPVKRTSIDIGPSARVYSSSSRGRRNRGHLAVLTRRRMGHVPGDDHASEARDRSRANAAAADRGGASLDRALAPRSRDRRRDARGSRVGGRSIRRRSFSSTRISPPGCRPNGGRYVVSNARLTRAVPANKKLVARSGRVTGYLARYDKGAGKQLQTIQSCDPSVRSPEGARTVLLWIDAEQRSNNARRSALFATAAKRRPSATRAGCTGPAIPATTPWSPGASPGSWDS